MSIMSRERWEQIKNMTPEEKAAEAARREELRKKWKEAADNALAGGETNLPPWLVENERRAREQYDDKGLPRPSLTERIKDYLGRVESGEAEPMEPTNFGEMLGIDSTRWLDKVTGQEVTNPDGTPLTPPMQTPPADVPTPPLEKTLEQQVWERDQMPKRTPDAQGRLYPDKNDPGFIDPRIGPGGTMTMQYIFELDDPNWRPGKNYGPGWKEQEMFGNRSSLNTQEWNNRGEGVQYRL